MSFEYFPVPSTPHDEVIVERQESLPEQQASSQEITPHREDFNSQAFIKKLDEEYVTPLNELAQTDTTKVIRVMHAISLEYDRLMDNWNTGGYRPALDLQRVVLKCIKAVAPELLTESTYKGIKGQLQMLDSWQREEASVWEAKGEAAANREKFLKAFEEACTDLKVHLDVPGL